MGFVLIPEIGRGERKPRGDVLGVRMRRCAPGDLGGATSSDESFGAVARQGFVAQNCRAAPRRVARQESDIPTTGKLRQDAKNFNDVLLASWRLGAVLPPLLFIGPPCNIGVIQTKQNGYENVSKRFLRGSETRTNPQSNEGTRN